MINTEKESNRSLLLDAMNNFRGDNITKQEYEVILKDLEFFKKYILTPTALKAVSKGVK